MCVEFFLALWSKEDLDGMQMHATEKVGSEKKNKILCTKQQVSAGGYLRSILI